MPQMDLDFPVRGRLTTVAMQDPEWLYEQAKQRMAELHATADRRRLVRPRRRPSGLTQSAILLGWRRVARGLFALRDRLR